MNPAKGRLPKGKGFKKMKPMNRYKVLGGYDSEEAQKIRRSSNSDLTYTAREVGRRNPETL